MNQGCRRVSSTPLDEFCKKKFKSTVLWAYGALFPTLKKKKSRKFILKSHKKKEITHEKIVPRHSERFADYNSTGI